MDYIAQTTKPYPRAYWYGGSGTEKNVEFPPWQGFLTHTGTGMYVVTAILVLFGNDG